MSYDLEKMRFGGQATSIAEDELAASFCEDEGDRLLEMLFDEYQQQGAPVNRKAWLRRRLEELFACVDQRPRWIESVSVPTWPFCNGRPMVFINQLEVPRTPVSESRLVPSAVLYVFGARVETEYGWELEYHVVEQLPDLP